MIKLLILLFVCSIVKGLTNFDYCDPIYCPDDTIHIACDNDGSWYPNCVNPVQINMTAARQQALTNAHNTVRNSVAQGLAVGLPSADKMPTLEWDDNLQFFAELNTKQCAMQVDECHNTPAIYWAGQNIRTQCTTAISLNPDNLFVTMVNGWVAKAASAAPSDIANFQDNPNGSGVFTQLVQDKASRIGCGAATYKKGSNNCLLLVCNYDYVNIFDQPVYSTGPATSGCQTGANSVFPGLCSAAEVVNPSPY